MLYACTTRVLLLFDKNVPGRPALVYYILIRVSIPNRPPIPRDKIRFRERLSSSGYLVILVDVLKATRVVKLII